MLFLIVKDPRKAIFDCNSQINFRNIWIRSHIRFCAASQVILDVAIRSYAFFHKQIETSFKFADSLFTLPGVIILHLLHTTLFKAEIQQQASNSTLIVVLFVVMFVTAYFSEMLRVEEHIIKVFFEIFICDGILLDRQKSLHCEVKLIFTYLSMCVSFCYKKEKQNFKISNGFSLTK